MATTKKLPKSCGPQHWAQEVPTAEWDVEQLRRYAQAQYSAILKSEESTTSLYWRLGRALNLVRGQFAYGQWQRFLKDIGIDKTRAAKARSIARTCESEQDVEGMTVEEAYGRRQRQNRKRGGNRNEKGSDDPDLMAMLAGVCEFVDSLLTEPSVIDAVEADELLPAVEAALSGLQQLHAILDRVAAT